VAVAGCTQAPPAVSPSPLPDPISPPTDTPTPTPTPTIDTTPRWPLTGVPLKDGEDKKAAHQAVAVKVPVEKRSFPQSGVNQADIVFWESQGKSYDITRLCAIFHSKFPDEGVNPVRSTRPVDVALLARIKPILACAGAVAWVIKYVKKNKKHIELREKYGDRSDRWAFKSLGGWWKGADINDKRIIAYPKNLSAKATLAKDVIPPVYFPYAAPGEEPSTATGTPATQVTLTHNGSAAPGGDGKEGHRYEYDAKKNNWPVSIRFQEKAGKKWMKYTVRNGKRVAPANVMILFCQWKMGVMKGYSGHKEPLYSMVDGADKFIYFNAGKYVTGTWTKGAATDPFVFTLDDGTPLKMATGSIWVDMPQHDSKVTIK
jgi:hypothetical protein